MVLGAPATGSGSGIEGGSGLVDGDVPEKIADAIREQKEQSNPGGTAEVTTTDQVELTGGGGDSSDSDSGSSSTSSDVPTVGIPSRTPRPPSVRLPGGTDPNDPGKTVDAGSNPTQDELDNLVGGGGDSSSGDGQASVTSSSGSTSESSMLEELDAKTLALAGAVLLFVWGGL